jgi:hypothetical protein
MIKKFLALALSVGLAAVPAPASYVNASASKPSDSFPGLMTIVTGATPKNGCAPVMPWDFVRTNSVFGLIHGAGGYVAWSDKHPAYSSIAGHGGTLDDFYGPEINSLVVALPGVKTPDGVDCSTIPDTAADLTAWTNSFTNIRCYDTLKVNAVLNWINGKSHLGGPAPKTPTIFGMNFQAVSVGQKYIENGLKGGYQDAAGTPTSTLVSGSSLRTTASVKWCRT